jgi:hypothetical protein
MQVELFDARVLQPLVRYLEGHGARSEPLLDRGHIPGELIDEGGWITSIAIGLALARVGKCLRQYESNSRGVDR